MNIYQALNIFHVLAVVIFLGNILTGFFWMTIAYRTKNIDHIIFVTKTLIKSDKWVTLPSVLIIVLSGFYMAGLSGLSVLKTGWILWSIILFSISGLCFAFKVGPLQNKLYAIAAEGYKEEPFGWDDYGKTYREWVVWGLISIGTPMVALALMIAKVPA